MRAASASPTHDTEVQQRRYASPSCSPGADGRLLGCLGRRDHLGVLGLLRDLDTSADERIAAALHVALACKRPSGPFCIPTPMSSVGG
jgi:hypothetical protein